MLRKFRTLKWLKSLLVGRCRVANGTAGQKKMFRVKYFSGALSYGAKIHGGTHIKKYIKYLHVTIFWHLFFGARNF